MPHLFHANSFQPRNPRKTRKKYISYSFFVFFVGFVVENVLRKHIGIVACIRNIDRNLSENRNLGKIG